MAKFVFNAGCFFGSPLTPAPTSTIVTVYDATDDTVVNDIWTDYEGTDPKGNPFTLDSDALIQFYVNPGRYNIVATNTGSSQTWPNWLAIDPDVTAGAASFSTISGSYSDNAGLDAAVESKQDAIPTTQELTADYTLTTADNGKHFYTLVGTSADIDITVPASLGDGFHCSVYHRGTGSLTWVESGTTINAQTGSTLVHSQGCRSSIIENGGSNIFDCVGITVSS